MKKPAGRAKVCCFSRHISATGKWARRPGHSVQTADLYGPHPGQPFSRRDHHVRPLQTGIGNIHKKNVMSSILSQLRKGEVLKLLIDQNAAAREGVFVNFFGRPACATTGIALMAIHTVAAVLPSHARMPEFLPLLRRKSVRGWIPSTPANRDQMFCKIRKTTTPLLKTTSQVSRQALAASTLENKPVQARRKT